MTHRSLSLPFGAALWLGCSVAQPVAADAGDTSAAKQWFDTGVAHKQDRHWGLALDAFRKSLSGSTLPDQIAAVQFNMAICEYNLSQFVSARQRLKTVLREPELLGDDTAAQAEKLLKKVEPLFVKVEIHLEPETATLLVDDEPLVPSADDDNKNTFVVSQDHDADAVQSLNLSTFTVLLEAGDHQFRAKRQGHGEVALTRSYQLGQSYTLPLVLALLPATLSVTSDPGGAQVRLNERYQGYAPGSFDAPAGTYKLGVELNGYIDYRQALTLEPGQRVDLRIPLTPETPWFRKWWVWGAAGAIVAGGVITAIVYATRTPQMRPYDGGSAGWVAQAP
jgi:hypothetical protein